jgi:hypothetical protein
MPRLTAELVASSPQFMNPLKERELDLRGNSIPAIENLGAARVRKHELSASHAAVSPMHLVEGHLDNLTFASGSI